VERDRAAWLRIGGEPAAGLDRLQQRVEQQQIEVQALVKKEGLGNLDKDERRRAARLQRMQDQLRSYREYLRSVSALSEPGTPQIPRRTMGEINSIYQLQNYVVGPATGGLAVGPDGSLDWQRSFRRVNYFSFFTGIQVRNVPQAAVSARPVDFVAVRAPREALVRSLPAELAPDTDGVWLYKDAQSQAFILRRAGRLRYVPVKELEETAQGDLRFTIADWRAGLPVALYEGVGAEWLAGWHSERDWLRATHRTAYSNAVIGLFAQLARRPEGVEPVAQSETERLFQEFGWRERRAAEADLLILAANHWNFNVRSFNPGGNHGSFFPVSTHATLMFAGGARTGIPRGLKISEPYDALSFAPTVLKLAGMPQYAQLPGQVIEELFPAVPASGAQEGR